MNWFRNLPERVRTVLIYAPIPVLLVVLSPISAWLVFTLLAVIATWEWRNIILQKRELFYTRQTQISILGVVISMLLVLLGLTYALISVMAFSINVFVSANKNRRVDLMIAQIIPSLVGIAAYLLRDAPHGLAWIGLIFVITSSSDTAAYFVGKAIGRTKFAPKISPNKTWEGAIGGWIFAMIAAWIYAWLFLPELHALNFFVQMILFWLLAFIGQLGDLSESYVKRKYNVKDSGTIFPGHGGVMDRFDSFATVSLAVAVLIFILGL